MGKMSASHFLHTIDSSLPRFEVPSSKISILHRPSEFLDNLLSGIAAARRRIFLCSLYIGTDVPSVLAALQASLRTQPQLSLYILLDGLRSTRPGPDSDGSSRTTADILLPLVREFGTQRVVIRFYHTPSLRGIWKLVAPNRLNEGFGLQHIKLCGFDDDVMVTGANLSGEYFTNRQDRYYKFVDSPELVGYLFGFVTALGGFAYLISAARCRFQGIEDGERQERGFSLEWPATNHTSKPLEESDEATIREAARRHLLPLMWNFSTSSNQDREKEKAVLRSREEADTVVYPLAQLAPLLGRTPNPQPRASSQSIPSTHEWVMTHLLSYLAHPEGNASWTLSTPYLSLTSQIQSWLDGINRFQNQPSSKAKSLPFYPSSEEKETGIETQQTRKGAIIAAAPEAMSFYGASGLAGYIPRAFEREFAKLRAILDMDNDDNHNNNKLHSETKNQEQRGIIRLLQWRRGTAHEKEGWTFHAKGWWVKGVSSITKDHDMRDGNVGGGGGDEMAMTVIGSSNYGERSLKLDLEMDLLVVTRDKDLIRRMGCEEREFLRYGRGVGDGDGDLGEKGGWMGAVEGMVVWVLVMAIGLMGLSI